MADILSGIVHDQLRGPLQMIQDSPSGIYLLACLLQWRPILLFVHTETRDASTLMQASLPLYFVQQHIAACEGISGIPLSSKILLPVKRSGALQLVIYKGALQAPCHVAGIYCNPCVLAAEQN